MIQELSNAIATAEGFFVDGVLPQRNHNPGDLRAAPWLQHPVVSGGFWQAPSDAAGIAGLQHQIALDIARGMTLRQLITAWAPPSDGNNTRNYLAETLRRLTVQGLSIDPDTPLQNYLTIKSIP